MAQFYGPSAINNPFYMAAIEANNPLLPVGNNFPMGAAYTQSYGFTPAAPVVIPEATPAPAPLVEAPQPITYQRPTRYLPPQDFAPPMDVPAFTPSYASMPGYEAVDVATNPVGMEQAGYAAYSSNPADVAAAAAQAARDEYSRANPSPFSALANVADQPISTTVNSFLDRTFNQPASLVGAITGSSLMSMAANAMARQNLGQLAYDRAMELQGVPGYSTGSIDGQTYSISPGPFGFGRVMSGVVPDWFDIDMAEKMSAVNAGLDPSTGEGLSGFSKGIGGYNSMGQFVDAYGNISAMGTMQNAIDLADQQGISLEGARKALSTARQGVLSLGQALLDTYNTERGFTDMVGPPDYDPGYDPNNPNAEPDINLDPLSAEMVDVGYSTGFGPSFDDGYDGFGGPGDADDDAGLGGEDV